MGDAILPATEQIPRPRLDVRGFDVVAGEGTDRVERGEVGDRHIFPLVADPAPEHARPAKAGDRTGLGKQLIAKKGGIGVGVRVADPAAPHPLDHSALALEAGAPRTRSTKAVSRYSRSSTILPSRIRITKQ